MWLEQDAGETIEQANARLNLVELRFRLADKSQQAHQRTVDGIMAEGGSGNPMGLRAREFNRMAEQHYRETLRRDNLREAFEQLREDVRALAKCDHAELAALVRLGVRVQDPARFLDSLGTRLVNEELTAQEVATVVNLLLLLSTIEAEQKAQCHA